jgi:hypothetical protein
MAAPVQKIMDTSNNMSMRMESLFKFCKEVAVPTLLWGLESWTLNLPTRELNGGSRSEVCKVCFRLQESRPCLKQARQKLNVFNTLKKVNEYQTNQYHHLERMNEGNLLKDFTSIY